MNFTFLKCLAMWYSYDCITHIIIAGCSSEDHSPCCCATNLYTWVSRDTTSISLHDFTNYLLFFFSCLPTLAHTHTHTHTHMHTHTHLIYIDQHYLEWIRQPHPHRQGPDQLLPPISQENLAIAKTPNALNCELIGPLNL